MNSIQLRISTRSSSDQKQKEKERTHTTERMINQFLFHLAVHAASVASFRLSKLRSTSPPRK